MRMNISTAGQQSDRKAYLSSCGDDGGGSYPWMLSAAAFAFMLSAIFSAGSVVACLKRYWAAPISFPRDPLLSC
jgi:hypothetical protein